MKSPVVKRSIVVAGHKTSVSLEEAFWNGMKEISGLRDMTLSELVGEIDNNRQQGNLSSAIRLFVLDYFRTRAMSRRTGCKTAGLEHFRLGQSTAHLGGLVVRRVALPRSLTIRVEDLILRGIA